MQYVYKANDLKSVENIFVLRKDKDCIDFSAYIVDTAEKSKKENADCRGYFLKKGFSDVLKNVDPNVMEPIYKDFRNEEARPSSTNEAIDLIYRDELTLSGFRFKENITDAQKGDAFGKLIDCFVATSKNLDFSSDKNLFSVQNGLLKVTYNNGGSEGMEIDGSDIQERVGLDMPDDVMQQWIDEYDYDADGDDDDNDYESDYQLEDVENGLNEEKNVHNPVEHVQESCAAGNAKNRLSVIRKKLAGKIDKKLGTNLSDVKLPKKIKNMEAMVSKYFNEDRR